MLVDTHIHLQDTRYAHDLTEVLNRAAAKGVSAVIVPGTNLTDSRHAIKLAERFAQGPCQVYAAVGVHPTETHLLSKAVINELRVLAHHERVVAVGEIGLDYYWPKISNRSWYCADPNTQRRALEIQLDLASELSLPVILHDREAHEDTLAMIEKWHNMNPVNRGVLHSYSGGVDKLKQVIDLGFYISLSGPITYKKADELRRVAKVTPDAILLVETDGPYLTPEPHRGKRNEPQYVHLVAERIAEVRSLSPAELADITTRNAVSLFQLMLNQQ